MVIWYIFWSNWYTFWSNWYIFPVLVCCTKKNLATLQLNRTELRRRKADLFFTVVYAMCVYTLKPGLPDFS
jgi:hypothetical protein